MTRMVAGQRRRPAASSSSSDITPPRDSKTHRACSRHGGCARRPTAAVYAEPAPRPGATSIRAAGQCSSALSMPRRTPRVPPRMEAVAQTPRASGRPVSRRVICLGRPSRAVRTAYTRSPLGSPAVSWLCATASMEWSSQPSRAPTARARRKQQSVGGSGSPTLGSLKATARNRDHRVGRVRQSKTGFLDRTDPAWCDSSSASTVRTGLASFDQRLDARSSTGCRRRRWPRRRARAALQGR